MRSVHPALFLFLFFILPAQSVERQVLSQHIPAAAQNAVSTGSLSHWTRMNLAIGLPLRNQQALKELLEQLYDRASTNYHRFLTPQQFAERFGPTEENYQALVHFAQVNGLIVTGKHSNRALLEVNGSVASIQKAFHVNLLTYEHPTEQRSFFAPDTEPSIELSVPILAISGLDNYIVPRPLFRAFDPNKPKPANGSGPLGFYLGTDFRRA